MDFGRVLKRAWDIVWQHKILWLFGFLVFLTSHPGNWGGDNVRYTFDRWDLHPPEWGQVAIITMLVLLGLLILIALLVLATIARGALIEGVRQAEEEGQVSGKKAWQMGVARFWSLLGIGLLLFLAMIVLILPLIALIVVGVAISEASGTAPEANVLLVCGVCLCALPLAIVGIALNLIRVYADRACVLEKLGSVDAIGRGWEVLKQNIGSTLVVGLILLIINLIIGAIFFGGALTLGVPTAGILSAGRVGVIGKLGLCCLGLIGLLIVWFVGSIVQAFTSAMWTLTYMALKPGKAVAD